MKRTRRLSALLSLAVLAAGLAACGGASRTSAKPGEGGTGNGTLKVGLVTDVGELNDHGFNYLAYTGLKRAERELGIAGKVAESNSAADYIPNLATLARKGYGLIVSVGYAQGSAVATVARRFPKARFAIIDVDQRSLPHRPRNVVGLVFHEEQAGYLAGYLSALVDGTRRGPHVIGSVGGVKQPPVDRFIAGFQAGARRALPGIRLLNDYSQDWDDQAKCKELALGQIARGAGVVFQVAGGCGLGALDAAKEKHVWGVGVDADQSFLGPHVLTSAEKKVDQAVFLTIRSVVRGTWRGGRNLVFGVRQDGVGLGRVSARAPRGDLARVDRVARLIAAGKVQIPTALAR
jgi:basic membrane protein A and related proteins